MMNKSVRKFLIAGNWKMNKNSAEAVDLVKEIQTDAGDSFAVSILVCPPFTALESVAGLIGGSSIQLGAQNMHPEASGAYTGEVSAEMLRHLYVTHVVLGHSERREYFQETDAFINRKALAALEGSLKPIVCVGETLEDREAEQTLEVVKRQISGSLANVPSDKADQVIIAYEPVWAIGTGKTATPEMAQEVHALIRGLLSEQFGESAAQKIRILYGGSMKPDNAEELLSQPDVDGGLIGGASLEARPFLKIIETAARLSS